VVIFGLGAIGLLAIQVAAVSGAGRIIAVNRSYNDERLGIAERFGATHVLCEAREDIISRIIEITEGEKVIPAVDCAGSNTVLENALRVVPEDRRKMLCV
jgi:threonine dehydrogenase-like Zn-dependent dehydrogenase